MKVHHILNGGVPFPLKLSQLDEKMPLCNSFLIWEMELTTLLDKDEQKEFICLCASYNVYVVQQHAIVEPWGWHRLYRALLPRPPHKKQFFPLFFFLHQVYIWRVKFVFKCYLIINTYNIVLFVHIKYIVLFVCTLNIKCPKGWK